MQKKLTKHILLFSIMLTGFQNLKAQQWLGRTTGNYSGTYGAYTNAAFIGDSKYRYYFNFWGRGVNFYNNYLLYNAPIKLNRWANDNYELQYKTLDGKADYQRDWLLESFNGKSKQFSFNQDIWGPAFMFPISKNWNMSINTRQRGGLQMFGISESAARLAFGAKMDSTKSANIDGKFGINAQTYQELSFTLGGILAKNERNQLTGGATFKFIRGLGAAYFKGDNLSIQGTSNNSANINGDFMYAYTDNKSVIDPFNRPYGVFSLNSRGVGFGIDLGLSYTYRSKRAKYAINNRCDLNDRRSDHDFKLAVAFNDLGGIRFSRFSNQYTYSSNLNSNVTVPNSILDPFKAGNQNAFDTIGQIVFGQMGATSSRGFGTMLPAAANIQLDFRMSKNLYTSVFWNQSLKGRNSSGLRSTSMVSVVPRFESRGFEFSMPLTLSENYRNFYVGAYTRIGPVFFGSDNLGGLLNVASASQFSGADIYGGVSFGIGHCVTYQEKQYIDPVYLDSTDSVRIVKHDTLIRRDTVRIVERDTIVIEKTVTNKTLAEKEKELKLKEEELNRRKVQLDTREREIDNRQNTTNPTELNRCKDQNLVLVKENTTLRDKNKTQNDAIINANRRIAELESELNKCKTTTPNKTTNEAVLQRRVDSLNNVLVIVKMELENCKKNNGKTNNDATRMQKKLDSLTIIIVQTRADYENCKKNAIQNNAEVMRKTEAEKRKAENDAIWAKRKSDSLYTILVLRDQELERCKKTSTMSQNDAVKKAEADRAKAENDARIARKQADSLRLILVQKEADFENCKKSVQNHAEVVKKLESDKAKAENDAKIARRQADSVNNILGLKVIELENCKKNSTQNNAEVVKRLETEKSKAENDAKIARKQADSLNLVVVKLNTELENCKKNSSSNSTDAQKLKQCEDNNALLKAEMGEMTKTINRLNTKNYELSYKVDSLSNALKNCCKNCESSGSNNNDELLKKCQETNSALNNQITSLKATIAAKDKSLDSMKTVVADINKRKTELDAQIVKLNTEISDLKGKSSDCSDIQKQLDDKNAELTKLKSENTALQNQIKTLNNQLNEYKTEYSFMVKQNQKCNAKLDSCMRGLYNTEPKKEGGDGNGGPNPPTEEGSNNNSGDDVYGTNNTGTKESNNTVNTKESKPLKGLEIGAKIIGAILEGSSNSGSSNSGSQKTNGNTGGSNTNQNSKNPGTTVDSDSSNSGNSGSGTKNRSNSSGSANNNGGSSSASGSSTTSGSNNSSRTGNPGSGANTGGSNGNNTSGAGSTKPSSGAAR